MDNFGQPSLENSFETESLGGTKVRILVHARFGGLATGCSMVEERRSQQKDVVVAEL